VDVSLNDDLVARGVLCGAAKCFSMSLEPRVATADERLAVPPNGLHYVSDHLSPELALVDAELADDARSALPQGEDTLARLELLVRAHRIVVSRAGSAQPREHAETEKLASLETDDRAGDGASDASGRVGVTGGLIAALSRPLLSRSKPAESAFQRYPTLD
jgi:hypothetical protein